MIRTKNTGVVITLTNDDLKEEFKKDPDMYQKLFRVTLSDFNISAAQVREADKIEFMMLSSSGICFDNKLLKDRRKDDLKELVESSNEAYRKYQKEWAEKKANQSLWEDVKDWWYKLKYKFKKSKKGN